MITFALIPACKDSVLLEHLHWHMSVLKQHNISYEILERPSADALKRADIILRTDISCGLQYPKKTINIDPLMSPDIAGGINRVILDQLPLQKITDEHKHRFYEWRSANKNNQQIQVFAPGTSADLAQLKPGNLNFITGHTKVEEARARDIKIDGVIISDSMALANPSPHALQSIASIQYLQKRHGSVFITTLANAAILGAHWPEGLEHLLIGVPENFSDTSVRTLMGSYSSFPTGNVLTALILPTVLAFDAPTDLYGFDGLLRTNTAGNGLAHKNMHAQNKNRLNLIKYSYGGGFILADEYQEQKQIETSARLAKYSEQGHTIMAISAPIPTKMTINRKNTSFKAKLYAGMAFADSNNFLVAGVSALIAAGVTYVGLKVLDNTNTLIYALAIIGTLLFILSFLHLRTRTKRLADLAERKANEKSHRAFIATNQRLDDLEKRLKN